MLTQAVIFAGGRGLRLMPLTKNTPKPMVKIAEKPFLDYLISYLKNNGISKIIILTGYKSKVIHNYYKKFNFIKCIKTPNHYETGDRLLKIKRHLERQFLLLYGDVFCNVNLKKLFQLHDKNFQKITNCSYFNLNGLAEYGFKNNIKIDSENNIINYSFNRKFFSYNATDIGFFVVNKEIIAQSKKNKSLSFQRDMFKEYLRNNNIKTFKISKKYYYITKIDDIKNFQMYISRNKVVFNF